MQYTQLRDMQTEYENEKDNPSPRRSETVGFANLIAKFRMALADLKSLLQATPMAAPAPLSPAGKGVQDLKAFHKSQGDVQAEQATRGLKIEAARQKVAKYRKWLKAEGVTLDAAGNAHVKPLKVVYDEEVAQTMTRVWISGGLLYTDDKCQELLDTTEMVTHMSGPGLGIYVMSATGNLHIDSHVLGNRHHSSLLAGSPTACAGEMQVVAGRLLLISNKSGHYKPKVRHMLQVLHLLQKKSVPMTFQVDCSASKHPDVKGPLSVGAFLLDLGLGAEPNLDLIRLMSCQKKLTPEVLKENGWRWHIAPEPVGVYRIDNNAAVDHKVARLWLKTRVPPPPPQQPIIPDADDDSYRGPALESTN